MKFSKIPAVITRNVVSYILYALFIVLCLKEKGVNSFFTGLLLYTIVTIVDETNYYSDCCLRFFV